MTGAALEGSILDGVPSLEVRWILPGQLDTAVDAWFWTSVSPMESREDAYLLRPDLGALSVKVRGGRALEVKAFRGSPGILDLPGRARGRMQYWQKWSFPLRSPRQDASEADGWRRVQKQRRTVRFSLTSGRIARAGEPADEARCALELTELRAQHRDWWSCGLEATGPPDRSAPGSRPPRRWYSPGPYRAELNSGWLIPCRTRSGFARARASRSEAVYARPEHHPTRGDHPRTRGV